MQFPPFKPCRKREAHTPAPRLSKRQLKDLAAAMNGGHTQAQAKRLIRWGLLSQGMELTPKGNSEVSRALRDLLAMRHG